MLNALLHRWLGIPYTLHVQHYKPKRAKQTLVFLHGIGNSGEAWGGVVSKLPNDYEVITIDLLGFGKSPRPSWATYDAHTQARSVAATLLKMRKVRPVVLIGHSLGSLVAVELARSKKIRVASLVLASPPFYIPEDHPRGLLPQSDAALRRLYRTIQKRPDKFVKIVRFALKHKLVAEYFRVTSDNVAAYMAALEAMIINQTSYIDATSLQVPTHIVRGTLDPFVISKNVRQLQRSNPHITLHKVVAGHEVRGLFIPALLRVIKAATALK